MQNNPEQRIDSKAVPYWRWSAGIKSVFLLLIPAGYYMAQQHWHWPAWINFILLGLILTYTIYAILFRPVVRWRTWRYEVSEQEIDLLHGVFIKTRTLIPMVRVQHVDTEQGPLLRCFGLSSVTIFIAGYQVVDNKLLLRSRSLGRVTMFIPKRRIQSLHVLQNPLQSRSNLSNLRVAVASCNIATIIKLRYMDIQKSNVIMNWLADKH